MNVNATGAKTTTPAKASSPLPHFITGGTINVSQIIGAKIAADQIQASRPVVTSEMIQFMQEHGVRRRNMIKEINALTNRATAMTRRALGWQFDPELEEDQKGTPEAAAQAKVRKAIEVKAMTIVSKVFKTFRKIDDDDEGDEKGLFSTVSVEKLMGLELCQAIMPDLAALGRSCAILADHRHGIEAAMKKEVLKFPVAAWQKTVNGFGELGLAVLIAECGNLSYYDSADKVWKRMGLAPFNGKACSTWRKGYLRNAPPLTAEEWGQASYCPRRRAEAHAVIADPLLRAQWRGQKKGSEVAAHPIGHYGVVYGREKAKAMKKGEDDPAWTKLRADIHARRVMTKRLVRDVWRVWNGMEPQKLAED